MAPLLVLGAATLLARLAGRLGVTALDWQASMRVGLAVMFGFTAVAHSIDNRLQPTAAGAMLGRSG